MLCCLTPLSTIFQLYRGGQKGVIRIRKSKNSQKKDRRTNNDLQHITHKTKDQGTQTPLKNRVCTQVQIIILR
jgi:hypothetical protein